MQIISKRTQKLTRSERREYVLAPYEQPLHMEDDLDHSTIRSYLNDLPCVITQCESIWKQEREEGSSFTPEAVTTSTLTDYQTYLQQELHLKPNDVNHRLISLKRYFTWLLNTEQVRHNSAKIVKLLHPLIQIMGYNLLDTDTTMLSICGTKQALQQDVENIAWIEREKKDAKELKCLHFIFP